MNFMNIGICLCVLFATLSIGSLSLPLQTTVSEGEPASSDSVVPSSTLHYTRQARSVSELPLRKAYKYDRAQVTDAHDGLNQLLTRLMSRKGSLYQTRTSLTSRASGPGPSHRIKDRDYLGWMDFGRRSAEEYEYSS